MLRGQSILVLSLKIRSSFPSTFALEPHLSRIMDPLLLAKVARWHGIGTRLTIKAAALKVAQN